MIYYDNANSPSYSFNKAYCERIEEVATERNAFCMGVCNESGYEVYYSFTEQAINYVFEFLKYKTFLNGFVAMHGDTEFCGYSMRAITPIKGTDFDYGKSQVKRLFTRSAFKERIPAGQFVFVNSCLDGKSIYQIVDELARMNTDSASLKNGVLDIYRHQITIDPAWAIDILMEHVAQLIRLTEIRP